MILIELDGVMGSLVGVCLPCTISLYSCLSGVVCYTVLSNLKVENEPTSSVRLGITKERIYQSNPANNSAIEIGFRTAFENPS